MIADLRIAPLLEKKVFIDTLAVRGLRFNTAREESGAIENPSETSRVLRRQIDSWADQVTVPPFSVAGLSQTIDVAAISPDSLSTPGRSVHTKWQSGAAQSFWNLEAAGELDVDDVPR